jgi:tryptophanyl-tRNA synthetase
MQSRALTALQPTNILHIGNLFGALQPMVEAQKEHETFLFVVDYHAITVPQDPAKLRQSILFATACYLAAGMDPTKTTIFQQSMVSEHTELAWILNCVGHMGELERMTQFKDKSKKQKDGVTVGLFTYPVLMAADILLYDTTVVPVGEDQKQHVELTRDLAERFNKRFGDTFVIPKPVIREHGARIMALDDPMSKMSKSAEAAKSYISLMDEPDVIRKKIRSAVTDTGGGIVYDTARPGVANLMEIMSLVTKQTFGQIENDYLGKGYGDFKSDLAEALVLYLTPLQAEITGWLKNEDELIKLLKNGADRARAIASKKLAQIKEKIGVSL